MFCNIVLWPLPKEVLFSRPFVRLLVSLFVGLQGYANTTVSNFMKKNQEGGSWSNLDLIKFYKLSWSPSAYQIIIHIFPFLILPHFETDAYFEVGTKI